MKKYSSIIIAAILLAIFISGCARGEKAAAKSMEQLYRENGIPVKLKQLQAQEFSKTLQFNGKLTGLNQGTEHSLLSGKVQKIFHKEGDYVNEGDQILRFPQDQTGANYQAVKANYDLTKASFERLQNLYQAGGISQQDLDNVEAAYLAASSQLTTVEQMLIVTAPISGYLTAVFVSETDHVDPGDLLFTISDLSKLKTEILVTEKEISLFKKGMPAQGYWEGITYEGLVTNIGYAMNDRLGAFEVDLVFNNPQNIMRSNINAVINVEVYHASNAIVLEKKFLSEDNAGSYVYVKNSDRVKKRYLKLGKSEGVRFEVLSGLNPGDEIVAEGKELLQDNSLILIKS